MKTISWDKEKKMFDEDCKNDVGSLASEALYDLCSKYPKHQKIEEVFAKVLIIGRAYKTNVEMKIDKKGSDHGPIRILSERMIEKGKEIDSAIQSIDTKNHPVESIAKCHGCVMDVIRDVTNDSDEISFVSKYLHFHTRVVPIYDRFARKSVEALTGEKINSLNRYGDFVQKYWIVAEKLGVDPIGRCKDIDYYLFKSGKRFAKKVL